MPPSTRSRAPENPAVPPPPVAGAAGGTGLADGRGVADGPCVAEGRGVAERPGVAGRLVVVTGLAEGLPLALGLVLLGRTVGDTDPVAPGERVGGVAGGGDPEQAETDAAARMVTVAQPTAAKLVPSLAMVMRILYRPFRRPLQGKTQRTARSCHGLFIT
jgi:hypothetical protein